MNEEILSLRQENERMKVMIGILTDRLKQVDPAGVREIRDLFFGSLDNEMITVANTNHQAEGNAKPVANEVNTIKGNSTK